MDEEEPMAVVEDEMAMLVGQLGACPKKFRREHRRAFNKVVSEVYSPPRITAMIRRMPIGDLVPGLALDITTVDPVDGKPWDFQFLEKRQRARALLEQQKPCFLIGSPMCTRYCSLQNYNDMRRDPRIVQKEKVAAAVHMRFVCDLYRMQHVAGRFFIHEHPWQASSWEIPCVRSIMALQGVRRIYADQCQLGAVDRAGNPLKKPTGFMSNSACVCEELQRRCLGRRGICGGRAKVAGMKHAACVGRTAREAAIYSDILCKAMLKGISRQLHEDGLCVVGETGMMAPEYREVECAATMP